MSLTESPPEPSTRSATLRRRVPIVAWLPRYSRRLLGGDILAGLIVAALLIPQALGYAAIANVPLQVGLYAVPGALLAYAVFGSSPNLIVGPASTVAVVSGSFIATMALTGEEAIGATAAMALIAGLVLIGIGLLRIGWVAEFLSSPIVTGFVFGLTLVIVVGEIPSLLGIEKEGENVVSQAASILTSLGDVSLTSAAVGLAALAVLFGGSRLLPRVPWALLVVVLGIVLSSVLELAEHGVAVVGEVPEGLPPVGLPDIPTEHVEAIVFGGMALALVGLAEGLSAARLFAARANVRIDTDQELLATGASNVAAGFTSGLAVAGSLSKTAAAERSGGKTQVTGLTAGAIVVLVLLFFTGYFTDLPKPVLSAIVIHAVWGLMDLPAMRRFRVVRRADFIAAMAALIGVALFGPLNGLLIAIAVSLLAVIYRSSRPEVDVLGRIPAEKAAWGRVAGHPERRPVPGILVVRLDAPLFWVNAVTIADKVLEEAVRHPDVRAVIIDMESTPQLEVTSTNMLSDLLRQLRAGNQDLYLVRVMREPRRVMERAGLLDELGEGHVWRSISQGVRAARRDTGLKGAGKTSTPTALRRRKKRAGPDVTAEFMVMDPEDTEDRGDHTPSPASSRGHGRARRGTERQTGGY